MKKLGWVLLLVVVNIFALDYYLPESLAFKTYLVQKTANQIQLEFDLANGYDIYSDQIKVSVDDTSNVKIGTVNFPKPSLVHNDVLGNYTIYKNKVFILIPIISSGNGNLVLNLNFQGCKGLDYCYPTMSRVLTLKLLPFTANNSASSKNNSSVTLKNITSRINPQPNELNSDLNTVAKNNPRQSNIINNGTTQPNFLTNLFRGNSQTIEQSLNAYPILTILAFFLLGILIAFTPCIFPMFPILLSVIAGKENKRAFWLALSYILGGSCVYALTGIMVSYIGISLQSYLQNIWAALFMSFLLIIFSISLFGLFDIKLPHFITHGLHSHVNKSGGSLIRVFIIGAISTLILSPCLTAPLAGALIYISNSHNLVLGGSALFMLGIGVGFPLLFISLLGNRLLPKSGKWMIKIKQLLGMIMILMAIYPLHTFLPLYIITLLIGIWVIGLAFLVYSVLKQKALRLFFSIVIFGFGGMMITYPYVNRITATDTPDNFSEKITNLTDLAPLLETAKQQQKVVILDVTAAWCLACREMDLTTWRDPKLQALMQRTMNIKIDVTNTNQDSNAIEKQYQVFAPPAVIIIGRDGNIKTTFMGNTSAKEIIQKLSN